MKAQPYIIICILLMCSCNGNDLDKLEINSETKQIKQKHFSEIISPDLSDSSKVEIIIDLIKTIEQDTSLRIMEFPDSTGRILAYFRQDTLVKIMTGTDFPKSSEILPLSSYNYTYYFFMYNLIGMHYRCANNLVSGRCNPVSASSQFYFYNNHIIGQEHDNKIGQYFGCGCSDLSDSNWNKLSGLEKEFVTESNRLKELITTVKSKN